MAASTKRDMEAKKCICWGDVKRSIKDLLFWTVDFPQRGLKNI